MAIMYLMGEIFIKVSVLDEAVRAHPNTWWWIKADGADLVSGLGDSVKGVWSGDVDLADDHQNRIDFIHQLGQDNSTSSLEMTEDLIVIAKKQFRMQYFYLPVSQTELRL